MLYSFLVVNKTFLFPRFTVCKKCSITGWMSPTALPGGQMSCTSPATHTNRLHRVRQLGTTFEPLFSLFSPKSNCLTRLWTALDLPLRKPKTLRGQAGVTAYLLVLTKCLCVWAFLHVCASEQIQQAYVTNSQSGYLATESSWVREAHKFPFRDILAKSCIYLLN